MEDLSLQQNSDGVAIQQFLSNYRKAPLDRRTLEFYQTKLVELNGLWDKLNQRDNVIRRCHGDDMTHPYFVNNFFENIANKVNPIREEMMEKIELLKKVEAKPSKTSTNQPSKPTTSAVKLVTTNTSVSLLKQGYCSCCGFKYCQGTSTRTTLCRLLYCLCLFDCRPGT